MTHEIIARRTEMGRTRVTLVCPVCGAHVTAFVWSLADSGKRCGCGAKHLAGGRTVPPPLARVVAETLHRTEETP